MKFTYNNFPIIKFMESDKGWDSFLDNCFYFTKSFLENSLAVFDSKNGLETIYKNVNDFRGILLTKNDGLNLEIVVDCFKKGDELIFQHKLYVEGILTSQQENIIFRDSLDVKLSMSSSSSNRKNNVHIAKGVMALIFFYQNAETKTDEVSKNSKKSNSKTNHFVEFKTDVKILNNSWFTTVINNNAFNVKGHLAWRACGKGKQDRKLVWIDEFSKTGYVRKAGVLNK
ncbi:hypothetical protein WAF17_16610 [Bernardetia sp. ABR2-2B]|uniref:hypothetical protein n=1 Tax=Bernardetia sp. ABR2-2B TaxID=3127472 RepID=UPI0030D0BC75